MASSTIQPTNSRKKTAWNSSTSLISKRQSLSSLTPSRNSSSSRSNTSTANSPSSTPSVSRSSSALFLSSTSQSPSSSQYFSTSGNNGLNNSIPVTHASRTSTKRTSNGTIHRISNDRQSKSDGSTSKHILVTATKELNGLSGVTSLSDSKHSRSSTIPSLSTSTSSIHQTTKSKISSLATQSSSKLGSLSNSIPKPKLNNPLESNQGSNSKSIRSSPSVRSSLQHPSSKVSERISGSTKIHHDPITSSPLRPSKSTTSNISTGRSKQLATPISQQALRQAYESLINSSNRSEKELRESLKRLRKMIYDYGLPEIDESKPKLRHRIWKILLSVYSISLPKYAGYIRRGQCPLYEKIKNDTFRTMATDEKFWAAVDENMLSRILNAFVWWGKDHSSEKDGFTFGYVQGMNVLAAPFLYVMPELDAYFSFSQFITYSCPTYVQPQLEGVHAGLKILDKCLKILDPTLFEYLQSKDLHASIYAFPSVLTFSACTPPLSQVLRLWDFLLAYGPHLNILCVIAQLLFIREDILAAPSPMKLLRRMPDLDAAAIVDCVGSLMGRLNDAVYDSLVTHCISGSI